MVSDVRFSGSTCTSMITYGRKVYCANVGDSRTILIRASPESASGKLKQMQIVNSKNFIRLEGSFVMQSLKDLF